MWRSWQRHSQADSKCQNFLHCTESMGMHMNPLAKNKSKTKNKFFWLTFWFYQVVSMAAGSPLPRSTVKDSSERFWDHGWHLQDRCRIDVTRVTRVTCVVGSCAHMRAWRVHLSTLFETFSRFSDLTVMVPLLPLLSPTFGSSNKQTPFAACPLNILFL